MDIEKIRDQIPACRELIYMNTGWSGPSPIRVVEAVKKRLEYECYEGPTCQHVLDSGNALRLEVQEAVAQLLNVAPSEISLTQNTTEGLNIVLNGFPWREGDEIITFDIEHSSVMTPCLCVQQRRGARVRVVPLATDDDWETILTKVKDELNERTRMIAFSHIQYSCGLRMPLEGVRNLTAGRDIFMLVDGAQTPGHISLDLASSGVDFYSIPAHKWLLGPDGAGALYIRRELIGTIQPSYVAHSAMDSVAEGVRLDGDSMDKFRLSTSSAPLAAGFLEAIKFIREVGVDEIEARTKELARSLKARLFELAGVTVLSPMGAPNDSGLTSFRIEDADSKEAVERLWQEHKIVARSVENPACIRISSDFFNTEEELDKLFEALQDIRN